ncbi:MAG: PEP-CTERM sorting domain-containing protein [Planctomycetota bacterium]
MRDSGLVRLTPIVALLVILATTVPAQADPVVAGGLWMILSEGSGEGSDGGFQSLEDDTYTVIQLSTQTAPGGNYPIPFDYIINSPIATSITSLVGVEYFYLGFATEELIGFPPGGGEEVSFSVTGPTTLDHLVVNADPAAAPEIFDPWYEYDMIEGVMSLEEYLDLDENGQTSAYDFWGAMGYPTESGRDYLSEIVYGPYGEGSVNFNVVSDAEGSGIDIFFGFTEGEELIIAQQEWVEDQQTNTLSLTVTTTPIPEPGTLALALAGLAGLGLWVRRKRAA